MIWDEAAHINFDEVFLKLDELKLGSSSGTESCDILLSAFNFFENFVRTYQDNPSVSKLKTNSLDVVYDKLFWGNNIEAMKPKDESYHPVWSEEEIYNLRNYMKEAFKLFSRKAHIN